MYLSPKYDDYFQSHSSGLVRSSSALSSSTTNKQSKCILTHIFVPPVSFYFSLSLYLSIYLRCASIVVVYSSVHNAPNNEYFSRELSRPWYAIFCLEEMALWLEQQLLENNIHFSQDLWSVLLFVRSFVRSFINRLKCFQYFEPPWFDRSFVKMRN